MALILTPEQRRQYLPYFKIALVLLALLMLPTLLNYLRARAAAPGPPLG